MEAEELDIALEELEVRLERLRALYEQYFLGIEKLEPQIPRKDVDRRIYVLRREKIRNTGKRFKLQTLIQRYNTFQQYWQRICREIENGTYKRHLMRAEKTVGPTQLLTVASRRRFGKERDRRGSDQPEARSSSMPPSARTASSAPPAAMPSSRPPDSGAMPTRPPGPRRTPTLRGISTPPPPGADVPISLRPPPPAPAPARLAPPPKPVQARPAPPPPSEQPAPRPRSSPRPPPAAPFESLELDMDFMGDWDPRTAARRPAATPPREPTPARRVAPPPKPGRETLESPPEAPPVAAEPATAKPASLRPPPIEAPKPQPSPAARPAPPKPATHAARPAQREAAEVSDQRLKEVHQRLVEASRSAGQSAVSYEGLAKSLRAVEAKLRAKHGNNRRVDFEVVLKDGKPVVKPVVR